MKTASEKDDIDMFVVAPGVWGMKDVFVNLYMIDNPSEKNWWLVDTGLKWSAVKIKAMAAMLFGAGNRPAGIVLTHGHFDHVGSVKKLAEEWNVPVYVHHLEIPYLTGISSYPPADPAAGGGLMSDLSFLYPKGPINIEKHIVALPQGGNIPGLSDWRYLHTPGHAPGHISLFRDSDKVLIAGDAIVTVKAESLVSTIFQLKKLSGPPKYFTSDWISAASSVKQLAELDPEVIATGHGRPLRGAGMRNSLHNLALDFQMQSVPAKGRYTHQPALMDDSGVVHIPPKNLNSSTAPTLKILGIAAAVMLTFLLFSKSNKKKNKSKQVRKDSKQAESMFHRYEKKLKPDAKKIESSLTDNYDKLKHTFIKNAKAFATTVKEEAAVVKDPAIDMFDKFKFNLKKQLR